MTLAAVLGGLLAAGGASALEALVTVLGAMALKAIIQMRVPRTLTGTESPYRRYLSNLRATGSMPATPWKGYLGQMMGFGTAIGMAVYVVWRSLF
jgi:hypothetical protein